MNYMFTGLIEEVGTIKRSTVSNAGSGYLVVKASKVLEDLQIGDSVSISGACQTVISKNSDSLTVEVMPETARRTTLGSLRIGDRVNLERAIKASGRFGGHMVNGHVDCVGTVLARATEQNAVILTIGYQSHFGRYLVIKGSVAIDGVSLTVASLAQNSFTVSLVSHTLENTTLKDARPGTRVNIEFDILAKYVEALLKLEQSKEKTEPNIIEKLIAGDEKESVDNF